MNIDERTAEKFRKRAEYAATRMGFERDREEISQEVLCRMLEGKHQHSTIDQAVIDVIRKRFGRTGTPGYDKKHALAKSLQAGDGLENLESTIGNNDGTSLDDRLDIKRAIIEFRGRQRAIIVLRFIWGMNEIEIADIFGVTESRVSQWLKGIQGRLSKRAAQESDSEGERENSMEKMGTEKGKEISSRSYQCMEKEEQNKMGRNFQTRYQKWLT